MTAILPATLLADAVLLLHFAVVLFIVGGLVVVRVGNRLGWRWVNARGFRLTHLVAIGVVVAESWLAISCPLTTLEASLRGTTGHAEEFIAYWVQRFLFYDAPPWIFIALYSGFGALVVAAWWRFPPRRRTRGRVDVGAQRSH